MEKGELFGRTHTQQKSESLITMIKGRDREN